MKIIKAIIEKISLIEKCRNSSIDSKMMISDYIQTEKELESATDIVADFMAIIENNSK